MPAFTLPTALILAANPPDSPSGDLRQRLPTGSRSRLERVRPPRRRT
jgi:hypothetical protein